MYCHDINNGSNKTNNEICKKKRIHRVFLANWRLSARQATADVKPIANTGKVTNPCPAGTKNPITVETTRIFEISERYFERRSNCSLLNLIILL